MVLHEFRVLCKSGFNYRYWFIVFCILDLYELNYAPSANITAIHVTEPNDPNVKSIFAEFNLKSMVTDKPMFKYMPVNDI